VLGRNRRSIAIDLKAEEGLSLLLDLVGRADGVIEAFRPGVAERLGFGPEACLARRPQLIYGRATGWGQEGPWRMMAGHDINYIALSGVLSMVGRPGEAPVPPLNLVGDFGGGGMMLAFGMVCAMLEARISGVGQVVDGAMVDGSALLATMFFEMVERGMWSEERGTNALDGGAPYYDSYETADAKWVAVGAVEPQFWAAFVELLGIGGPDLPDQMNQATWPELRARIAEAINTRTRDEWAELAGGTDTCLTPILTPREVLDHPHNRERQSFVMVGDSLQPAPAPRFSRTAPAAPTPPPATGADAHSILADWGLGDDAIARARAVGAFSTLG
jgi:alpha-methylacyl-CoA racemase